MVFDQKTKISSLKLKEISKSSAKQRAGRAGRTNEGFCFRLYSEKQKKLFKEGKTPEIQNMALDTLVLRLKSLRINDVINFPYLSQPSLDGIKESIRIMTFMGCLEEKTEKITEIGKILVRIPI